MRKKIIGFENAKKELTKKATKELLEKSNSNLTTLPMAAGAESMAQEHGLEVVTGNKGNEKTGNKKDNGKKEEDYIVIRNEAFPISNGLIEKGNDNDTNSKWYTLCGIKKRDTKWCDDEKEEVQVYAYIGTKRNIETNIVLTYIDKKNRSISDEFLKSELTDCIIIQKKGTGENVTEEKVLNKRKNVVKKLLNRGFNDDNIKEIVNWLNTHVEKLCRFNTSELYSADSVIKTVIENLLQQYAQFDEDKSRELLIHIYKNVKKIRVESDHFNNLLGKLYGNKVNAVKDILLDNNVLKPDSGRKYDASRTFEKKYEKASQRCFMLEVPKEFENDAKNLLKKYGKKREVA